jgi:hypothetical protein
MEPKLGTFHDAETHETVTRELTEEEVAALPKDIRTLETPEEEP